MCIVTLVLQNSELGIEWQVDGKVVSVSFSSRPHFSKLAKNNQQLTSTFRRLLYKIELELNRAELY